MQAVRERFTKPHAHFRGEREDADPLPDALAPAGRPWHARKAATPGAYRASLPERYRTKLRERIEARREHGRTSIRFSAWPDRLRHPRPQTRDDDRDYGPSR